jgi:hypothetical protein
VYADASNDLILSLMDRRWASIAVMAMSPAGSSAARLTRLPVASRSSEAFRARRVSFI